LKFKTSQENKQFIYETAIEDHNVLDKIIEEAFKYGCEGKFEIFLNDEIVTNPAAKHKEIEPKIKVEVPENTSQEQIPAVAELKKEPQVVKQEIEMPDVKELVEIKVEEQLPVTQNKNVQFYLK
jgi:hypothetical protein